MAGQNPVTRKKNTSQSLFETEKVLTYVLSESYGHFSYRRSSLRNNDINFDEITFVTSFRKSAVDKRLDLTLPPIDFKLYSFSKRMAIITHLVERVLVPEDVLSMDIDSSLKTHIYRMLVAIDLWEQTPGKKVNTRDELIVNTFELGPQYPKILKEQFEYGWRRHHSVFPDQYKEVPAIDNYNAIFPVDYLIFWKEDPNDWVYMNHPLFEWDDDLLVEFTEEIRKLLPDDIIIPEDIEALCQNKTTVSFDEKKMHNIPFYKAKLSSLGTTFGSVFTGKRCKIPIAPANTRDAVVGTIDSYNSVKWTDMLLQNILEPCLECVEKYNGNKQLSIIKKHISFDNAYYHMRDIKKCGLTFPRELIRIINKEISRKYNISRERLSVVENFCIYDTDKSLYPSIRGFCLGMANRYVSLAQVAIGRMIKSRVDNNIKYTFITGNDDYCGRVYGRKGYEVTEMDLLRIDAIDTDILMGLNIIKNSDKTLWSRHAVMYENYTHPDFVKKEARAYCAFSNAYIAPNIRTAKYMTSCISNTIDLSSIEIEYLVGQCILHWGYEFFPDEAKYSFELGGWIRHNKFGQSHALLELDSIDSSDYPQVYRAIVTVRKGEEALVVPKGNKEITYDNWSSLGKLYNIIQVDYDSVVPSLPTAQLCMSKKQYIDYFSNITKFQRNPELVNNIFTKKISELTFTKNEFYSKDTLGQKLIEKGNYAIPESCVKQTTCVVREIREFEINPKLRQNGLARYLEALRRNEIIHSSKISDYSDMFYPIIDHIGKIPPWFDNPKIFDIPKEVYDDALFFSSNPYAAVYEYYRRTKKIPLRLVSPYFDPKEDSHYEYLDIDFQNEKEIDFCDKLISHEFEREEIVEMIHILREDIPEPIKVEEIEYPPKIMSMDEKKKEHSALKGWTLNSYNRQHEICMLCDIINRLNFIKGRSFFANPEQRRVFTAETGRLLTYGKTIMGSKTDAPFTGVPDDILDLSDDDQGLFGDWGD